MEQRKIQLAVGRLKATGRHGVAARDTKSDALTDLTNRRFERLERFTAYCYETLPIILCQ
jgi:hypothetical protein